MKYVQLGTSVVMGMLAAACASAPVPQVTAVSSEAAVRTAEEVGARDVPQAAMYLQLAHDELDRGKALLQKGENRDAAMMLSRAQADAELALSLSREQKTRVAAQEAKARVQAVRSGAAPGSAVGGGPTKPNQ